jgi:cob(I)alamin adenosyltransferase
MKIYTKTGDEGETGLFGGGRVRKDHPRIAAYGALDELNATLGVARAEIARCELWAPSQKEDFDAFLGEVQNRLFDLGAELATPDAEVRGLQQIGEGHVEAIERVIDAHEERLPALKRFILPGGSATAAHLHVARCVCRRAERELVTLAGIEPVREIPVRYLNRLSDLLFVLARSANQAVGVADVPWEKEGG